MQFCNLVNKLLVLVDAENWNGREQIACTTLTEDIYVSTAFTGYYFTFLDKPAIFETMVMGGKLNGQSSWSSDYEEALRKHKQYVATAEKYLPTSYKHCQYFNKDLNSRPLIRCAVHPARTDCEGCLDFAISCNP